MNQNGLSDSNYDSPSILWQTNSTTWHDMFQYVQWPEQKYILEEGM